MARPIMTITEILNAWNYMGVFSYVLPFLLIFAVIFAILRKTNLLGGKDQGEGGNYMIEALVAVAVGLLALQMDMVSDFFMVIFPKFGIAIAIFLVLIILLGFFKGDQGGVVKSSWIGWVLGIGVVIWAFSEWDNWYGRAGFGGWFSEYIWALIVLGGLIAIIVVMGRGKKKE